MIALDMTELDIIALERRLGRCWEADAGSDADKGRQVDKRWEAEFG